MKHWRFKAFDAAGVLWQGVLAGRNHIEVAVLLRQQKLQAYDLVTIQKADYALEKMIGHQQIGHIDMGAAKKPGRSLRTLIVTMTIAVPIIIFSILFVYLR